MHWASFLAPAFGGQCEVKAGAARRVVGCPQAPTVRFDNGAADPESHANAVRFGGKEGVKYLVCLFRRQPHTVVAD